MPDPTEGITRVEDLPKPKLIRIDRNFKRQACPRCGYPAYRDRVYTRRLHDVGDLDAGRPRELEITYSQHCCSRCHKYFNADTSDLAAPLSHYTHRVVSLAVRTVVEDGLPYEPASWRLWRDFRVFVPWATRFARTGWKPGKKRATSRVEQDYLDWALADFSGYIAADEVYDGPFCVLSIVDNHTFKRVFYQVLERNQAPTQAIVAAFFGRFRGALHARGLQVAGITTDGSDLYSPAILTAFGAIPHQICEFHVLKQTTLAVLHAVAKVRRDLTAQKPKLKRGRPSTKDKAARQRARLSARLQQKTRTCSAVGAGVADLFTHRYLFVKHQLTEAERKQLQATRTLRCGQGVTRGLPHLRTLRDTPAPPSGACHGRGVPAI